MQREIYTDEYGCELTKEELEENDEIAHKVWESVKDGLVSKGTKKKHAGRPKKTEEEKEEIAPAQPSDPMDLKVPEAVINACTSRMEDLDIKIKEASAQIEDLQGIIRSYEGEYKVINNFIFRKGR